MTVHVGNCLVVDWEAGNCVLGGWGLCIGRLETVHWEVHWEAGD